MNVSNILTKAMGGKTESMTATMKPQIEQKTRVEIHFKDGHTFNWEGSKTESQKIINEMLNSEPSKSGFKILQFQNSDEILQVLEISHIRFKDIE